MIVGVHPASPHALPVSSPSAAGPALAHCARLPHRQPLAQALALALAFPQPLPLAYRPKWDGYSCAAQASAAGASSEQADSRILLTIALLTCTTTVQELPPTSACAAGMALRPGQQPQHLPVICALQRALPSCWLWRWRCSSVPPPLLLLLSCSLYCLTIVFEPARTLYFLLA